jgi:predicted DNA-binding WGR domain protein
LNLFLLKGKTSLRRREMKKYLELKDSKTHKFWEIKIVDNKYMVRFGRIGTQGQETVKEFGSPDEALKEGEKALKSKLKKGYKEKQTPSKKLIMKRFAVSDYDSSIDETLGKISSFLESKDAATTNSIVIGNWGEAWDTSSAQIVDLLVKNKEKLPVLTHLFIGDMDYEDCEISWIIQSDMSPILEAFPKLESFTIKGASGLKLHNINHSSLTSLTIICGGLDHGVIDSIGNALLPQLEHLELYLGTDDYGFTGTIKNIEPLMIKGKFPALKYLGLRDSILADEIAIAIAESDILDQVEVLDLSLGILTDKGGEALVNSSKVPGLKKLDLHYHFMSTEMMAKIKAIGINVDVSDRQEDDKYNGEIYRYVSVGE